MAGEGAGGGKSGAATDARLLAQWPEQALLAAALASVTEANAVTGAFGDVIVVQDGATDGATPGLSSALAAFIAADAGKTVCVAAPSAAGARNDAGCGTTSGGFTVTDTHVVNADVGKMVAGPGIPAGSYIVSVVVSTSFVFSNAANVGASATATVQLVISALLQDTIVSVAGGVATLAVGVATGGGALSGLTVQFGHEDTAATQAAINTAGAALIAQPSGRQVSPGVAEIYIPSGWYFISGLTGPANLNFSQGTIRLRGAGMDSTTLVVPSLPPAGAFAGSLLRPGNTVLSATTTQGSQTVLCPGILATHKGCGISGTNIPAGAQVGAVTPGVSFVMSLPAFASTTLNITLQIRPPRLIVEDMTLFGNHLSSPFGAGGARSSNAAIAATFPPFQSQAMPRYPGLALGLAGANAQRNDSCTLNSTTAVTDALAQSSDVGSAVQGAYTTIAAGSSGQALPQGTISVASTAGVPTAGTFTILIGPGNLQTITYTGISGSTFTGCTGGVGIMATGDAVVNTTSTVVPAGTVISAVNPGVGFTLSNAAGSTGTFTLSIANYALSTATTATTLVDSQANWTVNQWANCLVLIDEDKANNDPALNAGCGFGWVLSNTATTLNVAVWLGTRGHGTYTPSGQAVRYRIQGLTYQGYLHQFNRVRFLAPRGYATFPSWYEASDCVYELCGQPNDIGHNDSIGGGGVSGGYLILRNCSFVNGQGNFADIALNIPGMFGTANITGCSSLTRGQGSLYAAGLDCVIVGNSMTSNANIGASYDVTTHEANRGSNVVSGNSMDGNINNGGLSSARFDRVSGNVTNDSPLGLMAVQPAVPASGVAWRNPTVACDCTHYITANAGGTCAVAINGTALLTIAAGATMPIRVTGGGTSITLTYTSAPTWVVVGD